MLIFISSNVYCQDIKVPEKYKDLKWHYRETKNFEILALSEKDANTLEEKAEKAKRWIQGRWQLSLLPFNKRCMIVCVNSDELFRDFFHSDDVIPKITKSKNEDNQDREVYCIWISSEKEDWLYSILPGKIGYICALDCEHPLPMWAVVGMSELCNDTNSIGKVLREKPPEIDIFSVKEYEKDKQKEMRYYSVCLCLMLKKEFGIKGFNRFIKDGYQGIDFRSLQQFKNSYYTYCKNLTYDINHSKTPKSYFTWFF